jgi:phage-related protein/predicted XRE-type DNA-binding protein
MVKRPKRKPLDWVGSAREDLRKFPKEVTEEIGFALDAAQLGGKHPSAKVLKHFGSASVLDIIENFDGNTYRAVYTVRFAGVIYVLHAFQKKSKRGIETPKSDMDLIRQRLKDAELDYKPGGDDVMNVTRGSGNVFHDLGLPDADVLQAKADLVHQIAAIIERRGLTQGQAADILGVSQPKISELLRGRLSGFSMDRIVRFLTALDQQVKISVRPKGRHEPAIAISRKAHM